MTKKQQRFVKADLAERVRLATPLARELVVLGLSDIATVTSADDESLFLHVKELVGHDGPPSPESTEDDDEFLYRLQESLAGAYALGLAAGLMLRPEAFARGGK